jgi:hypothetical protein
MSQRIKALKFRIATLQAELASCSTAAMRRCVTESLIDAERQLTDVSNGAA